MGEVAKERKITICFQNSNQKFGYVLDKISTNLLGIIHKRGSLIQPPKFSGVGMGVRVGRKKQN